MTLHGNTMSPASPLPVATFATGMYCSPRLTESRGQTQLEEAAVGTSAETQLNNDSGTCLFRTCYQLAYLSATDRGRGQILIMVTWGPAAHPSAHFYLDIVLADSRSVRWHGVGRTLTSNPCLLSEESRLREAGW